MDGGDDDVVKYQVLLVFAPKASDPNCRKISSQHLVPLIQQLETRDQDQNLLARVNGSGSGQHADCGLARSCNRLDDAPATASEPGGQCFLLPGPRSRSDITAGWLRRESVGGQRAVGPRLRLSHAPPRRRPPVGRERTAARIKDAVDVGCAQTGESSFAQRS